MNAPLFLLIDTSTERGVVALTKGTHVLSQKELPFGLQNAQNLLPCIEESLHEHGLKPNQLQGIAVGIGPGSYTGIRVGVAVAQAMAYACEIPWMGICTLESFLPSQEGRFAVLIDAKIGGIYAWKGKKENSIVTPLSQPTLLPLADVQNFVKDVDIIATPHLSLIQPKILALCPQGEWRWEEQSPQAQQMAQHANRKFSEKEFESEDAVKILYLRKTQAEMERAGIQNPESKIQNERM